MLVLRARFGQSSHVESRALTRPNRRQVLLFLASAFCYAIGYPVALVANAPWGWVLVTIGGVLLFWLIIVTIRRIERRT